MNYDCVQMMTKHDETMMSCDRVQAMVSYGGARMMSHDHVQTMMKHDDAQMMMSYDRVQMTMHR